MLPPAAGVISVIRPIPTARVGVSVDAADTELTRCKPRVPLSRGIGVVSGRFPMRAASPANCCWMICVSATAVTVTAVFTVPPKPITLAVPSWTSVVAGEVSVMVVVVAGLLSSASTDWPVGPPPLQTSGRPTIMGHTNSIVPASGICGIELNKVPVGRVPKVPV